jgi:mitotic spindle assembly checkpoint protein MAD1
LRRKIKSLEEGLESSKLSESSLCPQEVHSLKEQIKTHESQTQRLKDYFKSSLQEFRNVIYMLLGYKIDRTSTSLYKLTSVYAEHAEDQLCFQLNSEGTLNLLENEFSATLEQMVNLHLRHQKSIPVFLSAITMDLFNNSTMATKTFEVE